MALIVIENLGKKTIQVRDFSKTLLRHLEDHRIDWMHACGGKGRCTTCMFQVVNGDENLEPITAAEMKYKMLGALHDRERLACQTRVKGNLTVRVPEENKLPHLTYSE